MGGSAPCLVPSDYPHPTRHEQGNVRKIMRTFDPNRTGTVTADSFRPLLQRLNLGLSEDEQTRVIQRLDPGGSGIISCEDFLATFEGAQPLGPRDIHTSGSNLMHRAPWEAGTGKYRNWNWETGPQSMPGTRVLGEEGCYEQQADDSQLLTMISRKLHQHKGKLRQVFRGLDTERSNTIDRPAFLKAVGSLRISLQPKQVERLYSIVDANNGSSGKINYEAFVGSFDRSERPRVKLAAKVVQGSTLAEALALQPEELASAMRSPALFALKQRLFSKAASVHALFKSVDVNGDGVLSVDELTACCRKLVPAMDKRQVAAVMSRIDEHSDGYINFRQFISHLVDDGVGHPRQVEPSLNREECPPVNRMGWGDSPLWTRPTPPHQPRVPQRGSNVAPVHAHLTAFFPFLPMQRPTTPRTLRSLSVPRTSTLHATSCPTLLNNATLCSSCSDATSHPRPGSHATHSPNTHSHALPNCRTHDASVYLDAQERAHMAHQAGVAPLIASLQCCAGSEGGATGRDRGREEEGGTMPMVSSLRRSTTSVGAARSPSLGPRACLTGGSAAGGNLLTTRSLDSKAAARPVTTSALGQTLSPASCASPRFMRFWHVAHADTTHTTAAHPASSAHLSPADTYLRKSNNGFMGFQAEDRDRKARRTEQAKERFITTSQAEAGRIAAVVDQAAVRDADTMCMKQQIHARHVERMQLYNDAQQRPNLLTSTMFGPLGAFSDLPMLKAD
ncbi:MAG: hypothetical protein WDW38_004004 [Sanguina aurantia]